MAIIDFLTHPFFLLSLGFWIISFILLKVLGKKRKNITFIFPFVVLFKTKYFNRLFKKISSKSKRFWKIFWNIGIVISFMLMLFALYFFISNLVMLIIAPQPENALIPLIPGVTISLPMFWEFMIPLLITISVHELSHAIASEVDDLEVKSSGLMGAGIFFIIGYGAFVEVDEFQLYSRKFTSGTRLRVAAAGVWSNIIVAIIALLMINSFPTLMGLGYENQTFQIESVISTKDGGFNENNIFSGDIVYSINDTIVSDYKNRDLSSILANKTDLKVAIGDILIFTCYNPDDGSFYNRSVELGHRSFVGFDTIKNNNTSFIIENVRGWDRGGNNYKIVHDGMIITKVNQTQINYEANITLESLIAQKIPNYQISITDDKGNSYNISVNYSPLYPGAHMFHDVFIGIDYEKIDDQSVNITRVVNDSVMGINEDNIIEGILIEKINGTQINLEEVNFKEFLRDFNLKPGDILVFTDSNNQNYTLITTEVPIQDVLVYIGISHSPYWIPGNWLGKIFGGDFPIWLNTQIFWTFVFCFSVALFNLLPTAIFDGGRMLKEVLAKIFGENWVENAEETVYYDEKEMDSEDKGVLQLQMHNVRKIRNAYLLIPKERDLEQDDGSIEYGSQNKEFEKNIVEENLYRKDSKKMEYYQEDLKIKEISANDNLFIEKIKIENFNDIPKNGFIKLDINYDKDTIFSKKRKAYRIISLIVGLIVLSNFILSLIKFGNTLFWM